MTTSKLSLADQIARAKNHLADSEAKEKAEKGLAALKEKALSIY